MMGIRGRRMPSFVPPLIHSTIIVEHCIPAPDPGRIIFPFAIGGLELPSQPLSPTQVAELVDLPAAGRRATSASSRLHSFFSTTPTQVAELVDALVSNTSDESRAGSIPALGTILNGFSSGLAGSNAGQPAEGRFDSRPGYIMADHWVYALSSLRHAYIYVGLSEDLEDRIQRHQQGREQTTKPYRPFTLLHSEIHPDRPSARVREKYLKSGQGKEFLKRLRDGGSK